MNKSSTPPIKELKLIDESGNAHSLVEWLFAHKSFLLGAFFVLIIALMTVSKLMTWRTLDAEKDFFQAEVIFHQFQKTAFSPTENSSARSDIEQLKAILERHPELKPKYEGPLAQTLLIESQIPQAQLFVEDIFKRTASEHLYHYQAYTQISLLIEQRLYPEALQRTQQLKSTLDQLSEQAGPLLYVFNLVRLAMLYQEMGQPQEELQAWKELENQPQRMEAVLTASQALKVGKASLMQYIQERKKSLMF